MQIGIIYTGVTEQLTEDVETELKKQLGENNTFFSYSNPQIINNLRESGSLTPWATKQLFALYWQALQDGANLLYNVCSSVGDVAHKAAPLFELLGVPLVAIDEEMAMEAVRNANSVIVLATLRTTLEPTCRLLQRCAAAQNKHLEVTEAVADVFGLEPEPFAQALIDAAIAVNHDKADLIVLAQGSMAWCEQRIAAATNLPVLSSPRFGAIGVKKAIEAMQNH